MSGAKSVEDLIAWQRCRQLSQVIFEITANGPVARDRRFQEQIRNAAQSAAPLIAEGFVRYSPADFARYLRMARAEIAEVQSDLLDASDRRYFSEEQQNLATTIARRAMYLTTRLLESKLRQIEEERRRKKRQRPRRGT